MPEEEINTHNPVLVPTGRQRGALRAVVLAGGTTRRYAAATDLAAHHVPWLFAFGCRNGGILVPAARLISGVKVAADQMGLQFR